MVNIVTKVNHMAAAFNPKKTASTNAMTKGIGFILPALTVTLIAERLLVCYFPFQLKDEMYTSSDMIFTALAAFELSTHCRLD
jgi:hypothetical protein